MSKEIHFFKDGMSALGHFPSYDYHNETMEAIKRGETPIYTSAISALDFSFLLALGYRIFLHENIKFFEIKPGSVEATDKEIRRGHDIRKIWIGGGFKNFFYETEI
jgi:hypothetical protein